jgi:3-hydroxy-9,10-secoandrosta-1,3,5(10)-triene-9,17-dione monooxygenase
VDKAYQHGGPRSVALSSRLQQRWRDVHTGQHHAMNLPDGALPIYGRWLLEGDAAIAAVPGAY